MLSAVDAFLASEVIDECLCQIKIIGQLSKLSNEQKVESEDESEPPEVEDDDIVYHAEEITSEQKLQMDLKRIESVLQDSLCEIRLDGTYIKLIKFTEEHKKTRNDFEEFHKRIFKERKKIPKMKKDIADAKREMQKEVDDMEEHIKQLKFDLQKLKAQTAMEISYVEKTIANDIQQAKKKCTQSQEEMKSEIEDLKYRLSYEAKADEQITKYWKQNEEELLRVLLFWKYKFFDDLKLKERELATLKKYKKLNLDKIAMVSRRLQADEEYLENDRKEKQRKQDLYDQEKRKYDSLVKLQAWWRGVMVRNKLGIYAVKKPEKKAKAKGKKGKKK